MRSARQPDGLTTDDEFTPYTFNDGRFVGLDGRCWVGQKHWDRQRPILIFKTYTQQLCNSADTAPN